MNTILTAVLLTLSAFAQDDDLVAKRDEKLKSEFLKKADWITDYDKARETAKSTGKPMLALFSRSYAPCPACHQLEHGPLLEDDFAKFSKEVVLFLHITTMIPGEKYGNLLEEKGGVAFPWIVFMDATGDIILEHQAERTAEAFGKSAERAKKWIALKEKSEKGDGPAKIDFATLQLTLGKMTVADAGKLMKEGGTPTKEQQAEWDAIVVNAQIREDLKALKSEADVAVLAQKYYARFKEGKPLPTANFALQNYLVCVLDASEAAKDAATFAAALAPLKEKFGKVEQNAPFFEEREKMLKELQAAPKK
jgi:hypothetical protein